MADEGRRGALRVILGAGAATLGVATVAPLAIAPASPMQAVGGARWVRAMKLEDLRDGERKRVPIVADLRDAWTVATNVTLGAVWLERKGDKVTCLSVTCPHLGCAVSATEEGGFNCPCHDSDFGPHGERNGGPSPRDLDGLQTRIADGWIEVDFRRYRVGTDQRVEIG
jgi:cytochrome b6-f complex iron-sulfur subunit/menaquinol-cytochrome c reductase iron-sulfur subunit